VIAHSSLFLRKKSYKVEKPDLRHTQHFANTWLAIINNNKCKDVAMYNERF